MNKPKAENAVFWDVAPCKSCVNRRFGGNYRLQSSATCSRWFLARGFFYPEDGGDMFLRNVSSHKSYTAPHPEDGILRSHLLENLKSYKPKAVQEAW
jgi:hypothetical protein